MSKLIEPAEDWHEVGAEDEPTFENSWVNYGSDANGDWSTAAFYKNLDRVYLKGFIKSGTAGANNAIFTLPEGYRPVKNELFVVRNNGASEFIWVQSSTGKVICDTATGTLWLSLSGISFRV